MEFEVVVSDLIQERLTSLHEEFSRRWIEFGRKVTCLCCIWLGFMLESINCCSSHLATSNANEN
jgi:hypothetical protein